MHHITESFRKYAVFTGRSGRMEFFVFGLFVVIVDGIVVAVEWYLGFLPFHGYAAMAFTAFIFLPSVSKTVRRLHDFNASGWWIVLTLVPITNIGLLAVLLLQRGTDGPNRFGPDPLAV